MASETVVLFVGRHRLEHPGATILNYGWRDDVSAQQVAELLDIPRL